MGRRKRWHDEQLIQSKLFYRKLDKLYVFCMDGIETPAENSYPHFHPPF
jgi:hypothetical protein